MSELKAYKGDVTIPVYGTIADAEVYLKKDVDAVITEKDKEIAELNARIADGDKDFEMADHQNERLLKIVRHQKHKRCLAMAERWLFAFYATNKCNDKFYLRSLKYRELAEKFKEAK